MRDDEEPKRLAENIATTVKRDYDGNLSAFARAAGVERRFTGD